jgi:chromosome segregation protein
MLKALEIVGFKSFADRTRFEFPPGVTVVVGPNGSGKSNIVDAIKWVLGEQSVKSLRGREMADVIFNGSSSRRALNTAEITLTFDNSNHILPLDTSEVSITRRVYRSGEGEYLINRNPARLRDIRDLLSGTGMGTQAYSVIEQGKVDGLLQSSPRDRRLIFEEAAGISRFKMRKVEALRRLEHVDQNLLRLSDIIDEVESRLRTVRSQAGKARRYKEHVDRLQELRTQVGQVDWKRLTDRLAEFEKEMQSLGDDRGAAGADAEKIDAELIGLDHGLTEINEEIRQAESQIAANRERIASAESTIDHERRRGLDLEQETLRYRRQLLGMSARAGNVQQQLRDTADAIQSAEENQRDVAKRLVEAERGLTEVMVLLDQLRGENEQRRATYLQQMRLAAALGNETSALESQAAGALAVRERCGERMAELDRSLDALQRQLDELRRWREEATRRVDQQAEALLAAENELVELKRQYDLQQKQLSEMRERRMGAAERAAVLDEIVRRHEGLSAGVKEVLQRAANPADAVFRGVHGLVADLFQVSVEVAPLVEIALGQAAQHVVATPSQGLLDYLQRESNRLGGRVGFLWLDDNGAGGLLLGKSDKGPRVKTPDPFIVVDLTGRPGVLGRADRFVQSEGRLAALAERLLARTWFVEKLAHALSLAGSVGSGVSYVTLAGDLLEPDGTLTVGPRSASTGLISRRSQLRAMQAQLAELTASIESAENGLAKLSEQIATQQRLVDRRSAEHRSIVDALAENRVAVTTAEERRSQLDQQRTSLRQELGNAQQQHDAALLRLAEEREKRKLVEAELAELEANTAHLGREIDELENHRLATDRETTEIKVELAKSEERLRNLQTRMRQYEESREERRRAIDEAREHLTECSSRAEASRWNILRAEAEIADLYLRKEGFAAQTVGLIDRRETLYQQRNALAERAQNVRGRIHQIEERTHAVELSANEVRHERTAMADRLREDYGIELSDLEHAATDQEQHQRDVVQQEIEELRQKINNLGNVNLEALEELEQLETRYKLLSDQRGDLTSARQSLEKIIEKINIDSRRLFSETLETVREHFQTLFRDLFGGGQADLVLEENVDILDSGVEILARPPGKEPRSISLLSGGEKTLTCVALLLAIFRSRPSPFCVLDEVDAALDEANIDRFTKVLHSFLAWTQFIIVTHSKKTMTCANSIYGVTMQESGVTKQVSVRFEDVSEDGHILTKPPAADEETQAA